MNRIIREHYPVAHLPEDLREGFASDANVRVTIEQELAKPDRVLSLDELFALRRPPFQTSADIAEDIRRQRDEWDD